MPFLTQGNTNWKFIGIVAVLAVIVGGMILTYLRTIEIIEEPLVIEPAVEESEILPEEEVETANWQTYRNEEYGFEIKYPAWIETFETRLATVGSSLQLIGLAIPCYGQLQEPESFQGVGEDCFRLKVIQGSEMCQRGEGFLVIEVTENYSKLPIKEWAQQNVIEKTEVYESKDFKEKEYNVYRNVAPLEDFTLGGIEGIRTSFGFKHGACEAVYLPKNSKIYIIGHCAYEAPLGPCSPYPNPDDILSTFRFIGSEVETVDWQVYRNEEHGYEFKYPSVDFSLDTSSSSDIRLQIREISTPYSISLGFEIVEKPPNLLDLESYLSYIVAIKNAEFKEFDREPFFVEPVTYGEKGTLAIFYYHFGGNMGAMGLTEVETYFEKEDYFVVARYSYFSSFINPLTDEVEEAVEAYNTIQEILSTFRFLDKAVKDEIADWQTYRNEKYGFEFKYPAAFDKFEYCKIREEDNFIGLGSRLSVLISNIGGLSLSEYIAKEKEKSLHEQIFPPPEEAWHEEDVYIGSTKGIRVTWFHGSRYSQLIYLLKDNTIFKIGWTAGPSCLDYYIEQGLLDEDEAQSELYIFEQIPNTFRFLD